MMAMPMLKKLSRRVQAESPSTWACQQQKARSERNDLANLTSVENFPSVVKLSVLDCPELKRISGLSRLHMIRIFGCCNVEVVEEVTSLDSMELKDGTMETLPEYLTRVTPRYLNLICSKKLYESLLTGSSSAECNKINHIKSRAIDYITYDED
ncbi:hypothetical protein BS78_07G039200 [Paspalum vaginatum]|nr:hypothetical protein BS78_07G039200 [Paspalum vaginatum]